MYTPLPDAPHDRTDRTVGAGRHWAAGRLGWPHIVGALAIVALLVAFQQVVRASVQQGDLRRKAVAALEEATWRCKALRSQRMRESCLVQLAAAAHRDAPRTVVLASE
jgi:hypothetical protein